MMILNFTLFIIGVLGLVVLIKVLVNIYIKYIYKNKFTGRKGGIIKKTRGWKIMPCGEKRISDFKDRKELELYRVYTIIKYIIDDKNFVIEKTGDYSHFYIIYENLKLEINLNVININDIKQKKIQKEHKGRVQLNRLGKEEQVYYILKKELLNYTYLIEGKSFKVGSNTLIAKVAYCDIKVDIQKSA